MSVRKNDQTIKSQNGQLGRMWDTEDRAREAGAKPLTIACDQPRASSPINDNQCVFNLQEGLLAGSPVTVQRQYKDTFVKLNVVNHVHTAPGPSQRKEVSPGVAGCHSFQTGYTVKHVKGASCVTQLSCAQPVTTVKNVVTNLPVGARLQNFLASLAGAGGRSESGSNFERGLSPPLPDPTQTHKVSHSRKLLCQSSQGQLPDGGIASAYRQKFSGTSSKSKVTRVFQPAFSSSETKQQVETYFRPEQAKSLPQGGEIQDGDTGNHQVIPTTRGMGHIHRLSGRLFPYSNTGTVPEIFEISCPRSDIPVHGPAIRTVHSTLGIYCGHKGSKTDDHTQGYKNPPVPRRLVGESQIPPSLSPAYPSPSATVPRPWLGGKFREIRTDPKTSFQLCGLPVRPPVRPHSTHTGPVAEPTGKDTVTAATTDMSGPAVHVPDRLTDCHRKASTPRSVTYEAHPVAPQKQLESTRITGEGHSNTQDPSTSPTMVAGGEQCAPRSTITPNTTCSANIYRRIKRRVGRSLRRTHSKRVLVPSGKQTAFKLSGTESNLSPTSEQVC